MSLDHSGYYVPPSQWSAMEKFYSSTLATLGYKIIKTIEVEGKTVAIGYGDQFPTFWLSMTSEESSKNLPRNSAHMAFQSYTHSAVRRWYETALANGGRDNGPPGLRTQFHPRYFGGYVFDPMGNNVEAVNHCEFSSPKIFNPKVLIPTLAIALAAVVHYFNIRIKFGEN